MKRSHFGPDHEIFRRSFRDFLKNEVTPHAASWERAGITPKEIWRRAGANGFLCTWADEAYGGAGARDFRYARPKKARTIGPALLPVNRSVLACGRAFRLPEPAALDR